MLILLSADCSKCLAFEFRGSGGTYKWLEDNEGERVMEGK
jgi:hypothetical protein